MWRVITIYPTSFITLLNQNLILYAHLFKFYQKNYTPKIMGTKVFTVLLLGFLCFFILSTVAVPSSRSLVINPHKHDLSTKFLFPQESSEVVGELRTKGRIDIELTDYPGASANPTHDPKSPGNTG